MIKIFISDLDGTLIHKARGHENPNKENLKALKKLEINGIKLAVATGRLEKSIREVEKNTGIPIYKISVNGGIVSDTENNTIHESYLPKETVEKIIKNLEKNYIKDIYFYVLVTDKSNNYFRPAVFISRLINLMYKKRFNTKYLTKEHLELLLSGVEKTLKINIGTGKEKKYKIFKEMKEEFPGSEIFITGSRSVEIGPENNSKGTAVRKLLEYLGISPEEAAYIGDSYNDLPAFEVCKHSFAMSHSEEQIKQKAVYIVKNVAEAVNKVIEINKKV
jgi:Cof subfamily protein (haloacid dehalogenase superfamily)